LQEDEESVIPAFLPLSSEHISDDGIYLLENGHDCLIYVGDSVNPDTVRKLFGVVTIDEVPTLVICLLSCISLLVSLPNSILSNSIPSGVFSRKLPIILKSYPGGY